MTTQKTPRCTHCSGRPNGTWCCDKAELEALRSAVDQAIGVLDSEITAPMLIDDGGAVREAARHSSATLKAARRRVA